MIEVLIKLRRPAEALVFADRFVAAAKAGSQRSYAYQLRSRLRLDLKDAR